MTRGLLDRACDVNNLPEHYCTSKPKISQSDLLFDDSKLAKEANNPNRTINACPTCN
jgi:hypothetical protein